MDKFAEYYNSEEKKHEFSQYVHENLKLIQTKMISEMRRKLNIIPDTQNVDGYFSLMLSLYGQMFSEMVYVLSKICQYTGVCGSQVVPNTIFKIFLDLYEGKNAFKEKSRTDVKDDLEAFQKYYLENIDDLRKFTEALPK